MNHFYLRFILYLYLKYKKAVETRRNSAVAKKTRYSHNLIILFFFSFYIPPSLESQEVGADL